MTLLREEDPTKISKERRSRGLNFQNGDVFEIWPGEENPEFFFTCLGIRTAAPPAQKSRYVERGEGGGESQLVWNGIIPGCKKIEGKSTTGNFILSTMLFPHRENGSKKFSLSFLCKGEKAAGGGLFFGDGYGGG